MEKLEKGPWEINWERFRGWGVVKYALIFGTILGPLTYLLGLFTHLIDASFAEVFLDGNLLKNVLVSCIVGILGPGIFTWYLNVILRGIFSFFTKKHKNHFILT